MSGRWWKILLVMVLLGVLPGLFWVYPVKVGMVTPKTEDPFAPSSRFRPLPKPQPYVMALDISIMPLSDAKPCLEQMGLSPASMVPIFLDHRQGTALHRTGRVVLLNSTKARNHDRVFAFKPAETAFVSSLEWAVGENAGLLNPIVRTAGDGVFVDLFPQLATDGIVFDLRLRRAQLDRMLNLGFQELPPGPWDAAIQCIHVTTSYFAKNRFTVRSDKAALILLPDDFPLPAPAAQGAGNLLLIEPFEIGPAGQGIPERSAQ
jgi:hypothetical protein